MIQSRSAGSRPSSPAQRLWTCVGSGVAAHGDQPLGEAGVQADHVAGLHHDAVGLQDPGELVVADLHLGVAEMGAQVDHHGPALHAGLGQALDPEPLRPGRLIGGRRAARARRCPGRRGSRCRRSGAAPVPSASNSDPTWARESHCVEYCRWISARSSQITSVAPSTSSQTGKFMFGPAVGAAGRGDLRRVAARVQDVAARQVQRQAEAEGQALPHLGDALAHLLGGEQVQAPAARRRGRNHPRSSPRAAGSSGASWGRSPAWPGAAVRDRPGHGRACVPHLSAALLRGRGPASCGAGHQPRPERRRPEVRGRTARAS